MRLQKKLDVWSEGARLPLAFDCFATKAFCPPWYWNQGPGWLSSQGVLQSDETKIWAQMSNFMRVRLQKQPDAWSEGVLLPLAFDSYATKVFCPPWYWNRGPGWLSSQGVLQSDETKIFAQISNFLRVRLQKPPDAWWEGVPHPLAFDCYATKVFCHPWYWIYGPGWLSFLVKAFSFLLLFDTLIIVEIESLATSPPSQRRRFCKIGQ